MATQTRIFAGIIITGCVLAIGVAWTIKQTNPISAESNVPNSRCLIFERSEVDFGAIAAEAGQRTATFAVRNTTQTRQQPKVISSSCGCVNVTCPAILEPLATGLIHVFIDPGKKSGKVTASTKIGLENSDLELQEIFVKYDGIPAIAVEPEFIAIEEESNGVTRGHKITVVLRTGNGQKLEPPIVRRGHPNAQVKMVDERDVGDKSDAYRRTVFQFELKVASRGTLLTDEIADFPVTFVHQEGQSVVARVRVLRRHHPFLIGPTVVIVDERGPSPNVVRLWARDGRTFDVSKIESDMPGLKANCKTMSTQRVHEIHFSSSSQQAIESKVKYSVLIHINSDDSQPYRLDVIVPERHQGQTRP